MSDATTTLKAGDAAPDFNLPTDGGGNVTLAGLRGKKVVLFFYPKADTSACTKEAIGFSQSAEAFSAAGAVLVGVSADPVKAQDKFKSKHALTTILASDESTAMLQTYGIWVEKSMYGKKYMGIERTTILVDAGGKIVKIWPKVKVDGHVAEVLAATKAA